MIILTALLITVVVLIVAYFVAGKTEEADKPTPVIDPRAARMMELREAYELAKDALGGQEPTNDQIVAVRDLLRSVTVEVSESQDE